jgi:adenylate cyclase class 2
MKTTETEVKIRAGDLHALEATLKLAGAVLKAPRIFERNVRYENADGSLTEAGKVVRLRQDSRIRLTYKEPGVEAIPGMISRTELEVEVDNFELMNAILVKLGFQPSWLYEKYRTTYELASAEVTLDEMPFGSFIEIEGEAIAIDEVLEVLKLSTVPRIAVSYSGLFFALKERLHWTFQDLTFENLKGLPIPADVWHELEQ